MKKLILFLIFYSGFCSSLFSQDTDYFNKNKEYHYNAIYIDRHGDTITQEKMILKPLGRPWLPQPWLQVAIKYIYNTDTVGYKNYVDPVEYFHKRNQKYFKKKGELLLSQHEKTGAYAKRGKFYMHPPRTNQYRMLFYSAHPLVYFNALNDSVNHFTTDHINIIGMGGRYIQKYTVKPLADTLISNSQTEAWSVCATSGGDFNDYHESQNMYDSTLDAIFTKEFGFIKLHYEFENNIKIQFDLEEVVYK
jgi:hypothetical protein